MFCFEVREGRGEEALEDGAADEACGACEEDAERRCSGPGRHIVRVVTGGCACVEGASLLASLPFEWVRIVDRR